MKTKIIFLILLSAIGLSTFAAGPDMKIKQGTLDTISLKAGSAPSANWQVDAEAAVTNNPVLAHTWGEGVGFHKLKVTPISAANCTGDTSIFSIQIFLITDTTISSFTILANPCPVSNTNATSTTTVNLVTLGISAGTSFTVYYTIGAGITQSATALEAAGNKASFTLDASTSSIKNGGTATVTIPKFFITGQGTTVLGSSAPTASLTVNPKPVVIGIQ
jgi:hypothetical protein